MTEPNPVVLWSKPEAERAGTPLLVLFHGYLANEEDLMGLADYLPEDFTIASVRAPQAMGPGYTWFPLMSDADYSVESVVDSVTDVSAWLDGVSGAHSSVSLLGFSMGMAVATTLLRHRPQDFAAVVGLSGFVVPAEENPFFHDGELAQHKVPFFWGRDQADPVIDPQRIEYTHAWLNGHTALTKILYSNMGHGINMQELGHVKEFLAHTVLRGAQKA
ncbi:alpha/beta hydrolase-fold protein [Arthrobacter zhangbolii]|uniref:Alpha/beta hydrolase-fold protein n=1 Tax=Arthrobacter zhangbolii TaxID=2886936 RepID=A0A9X1M8Y9_9MICC|nr:MULTISPECIES: alpha/beta fold hydrolase [Arthrobacter]MCC3273050.1 phospholipase [Arthrobacter zhangbolii]MCC3295390.1 phospholipase [Arthrobacter zhangbolii]MDN3905182.1 alpha/beta hydrolase-fold protein [Arthrobacter sp. YD2]UON93096.1 alpha/beta hydrolase-fold protein [Arthrobacter zhangbolii]